MDGKKERKEKQGGFWSFFEKLAGAEKRNGKKADFEENGEDAVFGYEKEMARGNRFAKGEKKLSKISSLLSRYFKKYFDFESDGLWQINSLSDAVIYALKAVSVVVLSFIFSMGEAPMQTYPFGIGLLCAIDSFVPFCFLGSAFAALFSGTAMPVLFITYTLAFGLRFILCKFLKGSFWGDMPFGDGENSEKTEKEESGNNDTVTFDSISSFSSHNAEDIPAERTFHNGSTLAGEEGKEIALCVDDYSVSRHFYVNTFFKVAIALFCVFTAGIFRIIVGGFLYYDLFALVFSLFSVPLFVYAFCGVFEKERRFTAIYDFGISAVIFSLVASLSGWRILTFDHQLSVAFFITLLSARSGGVLRGGVIGFLCGIAISPSLSPVFGIAGITAGAFFSPAVSVVKDEEGEFRDKSEKTGTAKRSFFDFSKKEGNITGTVFSYLAALAYGVYVNGFSFLGSFAPDILSAVIIFLPMVEFDLLPKISVFAKDTVWGAHYESNVLLAKKEKTDAARIKSLSDALSELSEIFYSISSRLKKPSMYDVKRICDTVYDNRCSRCRANDVCWNKQGESTSDALNKLTRQLYDTGHASRQALPDYFRNRCPNIDILIAEINHSFSKLLEDSLKSDKTEFFACDYDSMSNLLKGALEKSYSEFTVDRKLSKKLKAFLNHLDFYSSSLIVYGKRRKTVVASGIRLDKMRMSSTDIKNAVEDFFKMKFSYPEYSIDNEFVSMSIEAKKAFSVEYTKRQSVSPREDVCGDSVKQFHTKDDYFYSFICDGMGSGKQAALASRICVAFLEKMLGEGNKKSVVLELLNNFMRGKGDECFATIDMLEIDLISAEACFVKSGAASSFIIRDGNLFRVDAKTMPVGITKHISAEQIKFTLKEGDVVVMLSDGVASGLEQGIRLATLLTYEWEDDLEKMADKILDDAKKSTLSRGGRTDDMTVSLVRICKV